MKKGFTLMEVLAVLLVLAVVVSFAVPILRAVMAEVDYQRAKTAGAKMAEAIRIFYKDSKGYQVTGSINGNSTADLAAAECENPALTGIPPYDVGDMGVEQLFHCNYLTSKDFASLNYLFNPGKCTAVSSLECLVEVRDQNPKKSLNKGCFRVGRDMKIEEDIQTCD